MGRFKRGNKLPQGTTVSPPRPDNPFPEVNREQMGTQFTDEKSSEGRGESTAETSENNFTDFGKNLASYGNLFFPPPPPPKTARGTKWALFGLGLLMLIGLGVGAFVVMTVNGVSQQMDDVQAVVESSASSVPSIEAIDLSGLENQLDTIIANDAVMLNRLSTLESQIQAQASQPAIVFNQTNTPLPTFTPIPQPTQISLGENEYVIKADAGVRLVPNMASEVEVVGRFISETKIVILGGFVDNQGQTWLVFKPTRENGIEIRSSSISQEVLYDERPYAFIRDDDDSVAIRNAYLTVIPLNLSITAVDGRRLRLTPNGSPTANNIIKNAVSGGVSVLGWARDIESGELNWAVLDVSQYPFTDEEKIIIGDQKIAFIIVNFGQPVTTAFSGIDLDIFNTMPEYPLPQDVSSPTTNNPPPTDQPLPTPTEQAVVIPEGTP